MNLGLLIEGWTSAIYKNAPLSFWFSSFMAYKQSFKKSVQ